MVRHWRIAADRSFASGLTPPCGCIGTCRLDSHAGRTARGLAVGEIDEITTESIAESIAESIIDGACDPMGPLPMGCASGQSGRARLERARVVHTPLAP